LNFVQPTISHVAKPIGAIFLKFSAVQDDGAIRRAGGVIGIDLANP
jgi:hypothetical protein